MRITVKALGHGSSLIHAMKLGTLVFAEGPSGSMTARRRTQPSVLLIAGGVGITPMRALFETLEPQGGRITLLYRASSPQDIVFQRELEDVAWARGGQILWLVGSSAHPANHLTALHHVGLPARRLHEEIFEF